MGKSRPLFVFSIQLTVNVQFNFLTIVAVLWRRNSEAIDLPTEPQSQPLDNMFFYKNKNGPFPASFLFIFVFSTCYNLNWNLNWKKHRWCAWDSNLGRQDGRRERIHWAMAAPHQLKKLPLQSCWLPYRLHFIRTTGHTVSIVSFFP